MIDKLKKQLGFDRPVIISGEAAETIKMDCTKILYELFQEISGPKEFLEKKEKSLALIKERLDDGAAVTKLACIYGMIMFNIIQDCWEEKNGPHELHRDLGMN